VVDTEDMGQAVVAAQGFLPGETVLRDAPSLVCNRNDDYHGLFTAFLHSSPQVQADILGMFAPATTIREQMEESEGMRNYRLTKLKGYLQTQASAVSKTSTTLTLELCQTLLSIVDANAHHFQAHARSGSPEPASCIALFALGAKLESSCNPNVRSNTSSGKLEFVATASIAQGERVAHSYIRNVFEMPRQQRQNYLRNNKFFECRCVRCQGVDECRQLWCSCGEPGGVLYCTDTTWACLSCEKQHSTEAQLEPIFQAEEALVKQLEAFEWKCQNDPYPNILSDVVDLMQNDLWLKTLHPCHWLYLSAFRLISKIAYSLARWYTRQEGVSSPKVPSLLRLSAWGHLQDVLWVHRNCALARGDLSLESLNTSGINASAAVRVPFAEGASMEDVRSVVDSLCDTTRVVVTDDGVDSVFQAGRELILAGNSDLALRIFIHQKIALDHWDGLSSDDKDNIDVFVRSEGKDNPFGNANILQG
jgi:hypothetical protein